MSVRKERRKRSGRKLIEITRSFYNFISLFSCSFFGCKFCKNIEHVVCGFFQVLCVGLYIRNQHNVSLCGRKKDLMITNGDSLFVDFKLFVSVK